VRKKREASEKASDALSVSLQRCFSFVQRMLYRINHTRFGTTMLSVIDATGSNGKEIGRCKNPFSITESPAVCLTDRQLASEKKSDGSGPRTREPAKRRTPRHTLEQRKLGTRFTQDGDKDARTKKRKHQETGTVTASSVRDDSVPLCTVGRCNAKLPVCGCESTIMIKRYYYKDDRIVMKTREIRKIGTRAQQTGNQRNDANFTQETDISDRNTIFDYIDPLDSPMDSPIGTPGVASDTTCASDLEWFHDKEF